MNRERYVTAQYSGSLCSLSSCRDLLGESPTMVDSPFAASSLISSVIRQGDATRLAFSDGEFDRVVCQHGLQYVPDRTAALREMKRVLAPSGRLALSVFSQSNGYRILEHTAAQFVERRQQPL